VEKLKKKHVQKYKATKHPLETFTPQVVAQKFQVGAQKFKVGVHKF